jgi:NOL1/NOP2/fmu family ribosome biogenesis protein
MLAHEFVTRFGKLATHNILFLERDQLSNWMHGEDLALNSTDGNSDFLYIIKDHLGRIIGTGKYTSGRLRNLLPKRSLIAGEMASAISKTG